MPITYNFIYQLYFNKKNKLKKKKERNAHAFQEQKQTNNDRRLPETYKPKVNGSTFNSWAEVEGTS